MDAETGSKIRADIDSQLANMLVVINGGGVSLLAAFLTDKMANEAYFALNVASIVALISFLIGVAAAALHQRLRRLCNLAYAQRQADSPTLMALVAEGKAKEPSVCIGSRRMMWLSFIAFMVGGSSIVLGAIVTVARHSPT